VKPKEAHLRGLLIFLLFGLGVVSGLLLLVALLVLGSLLIVGLAVGLAQSLPPVTKLLADLACAVVRYLESVKQSNVTYRS
jgi:hypothetical protein